MSDARLPTESRQPANPAEAIANIPFHHPESAKLTLSRVLGSLSPPLASAIPGLLAESPDPDVALMLFDRLITESSEVLRLLNRHHSLAHYAIVVFGYSRYLGETLIQNSDVLQSFLREKNLDRSFSREEFHEALARFRSRSFETDVSQLLARFKRREYVRIMLRDVLKLSPLAETTAEISALSDVLIEEAVREASSHLQRRYGTPEHLDAEGRLVETPFAVLSLGKLGGNELNYASDVDLMYIFGDGEQPEGATITNREYFIRLAQQVTDILSRITREAPVFRIDMRLRPQGSEGELAISLSHALRYYAENAHDWERQALIKVRHSAGDSNLAREFIRAVQRHVYTTEVNFEAIETALNARFRMHAHRRVRAVLQTARETIDVKLDRGGIRDIEFLVQCLQRVYGGREPWLRSGGTLFSLQKLHDKGHISGREFHELNNAYEFLRHVEHRLQLRQGQQTHRLPADERGLESLRRSLEGDAVAEGSDLYEVVQRRMSSVAEIYHRIIHSQQSRRQQELPALEFQLRSGVTAGVDQSNQQILERLAGDSPALYEIVSSTQVGPQARKNLFRFLSSVLTSSERYGALLRHPEAVRSAIRLFDSSEYLTDILTRHPEELVTLAELQSSEARPGGELFGSGASNSAAPDPVFAYIGSAPLSYAEKLSLLRQHYRHRTFASGARDIAHLRGVYDSLAVSTAAANDAIASAATIAGAPEGLAVMAVGRLGTGEFDLLSDADLVFVSAEHADRGQLTKCAEQLMQALSAYTRDGMVFPVDARLRPRGGEGELLITPARLEAYFADEAQAWEALMYTKLRFVAGAREVADQAMRATAQLFKRFAAANTFGDAVREMRTKLEQVEGREKSFKASAGGLYDVDFLCAYLLIRSGVSNMPGTLRDRVWRCSSLGVLSKNDAAVLDHAAELYRTVEHLVRLAVGRARKWLPPTEHAREIVERLTAAILGREFPDGLQSELERTASTVREIYDRVLQ